MEKERNPYDDRLIYLAKLEYEVRCPSLSINLISPMTEIAEASSVYRSRMYIAWPMLNQVGQNYLTMQAEENAAQLGKLFHRMGKGRL